VKNEKYYYFIEKIWNKTFNFKIRERILESYDGECWCFTAQDIWDDLDQASHDVEEDLLVWEDGSDISFDEVEEIFEIEMEMIQAWFEREF